METGALDLLLMQKIKQGSWVLLYWSNYRKPETLQWAEPRIECRLQTHLGIWSDMQAACAEARAAAAQLLFT